MDIATVVVGGAVIGAIIYIASYATESHKHPDLMYDMAAQPLDLADTKSDMLIYEDRDKEPPNSAPTSPVASQMQALEQIEEQFYHMPPTSSEDGIYVQFGDYSDPVYQDI